MKASEDELIIEQLRVGNAEQREVAFRALYKYYGMTESLVIKNSGSSEQAMVTFHDALLIFEKKVIQGKYQYQGNKISSYLYEISRRRWWDELKKRGKMRYVDPVDDQHKDIPNEEKADDIFSRLDPSDDLDALIECIKKLPKDCWRVFFYFYWLNLPMKRIAEIIGYQDDQIARNKKRKCLKKAIRDCA